jgi:hypothetical protein
VAARKLVVGHKLAVRMLVVDRKVAAVEQHSDSLQTVVELVVADLAFVDRQTDKLDSSEVVIGSQIEALVVVAGDMQFVVVDIHKRVRNLIEPLEDFGS